MIDNERSVFCETCLWQHCSPVMYINLFVPRKDMWHINTEFSLFLLEMMNFSAHFRSCLYTSKAGEIDVLSRINADVGKKVPERPLKTQFKHPNIEQIQPIQWKVKIFNHPGRRFVLTFRERRTSKMFCPWRRFGRSHDLSRKASVCCFRTHVWFWCHSVSNHPSPMKIPSLQPFLDSWDLGYLDISNLLLVGSPKLPAARSEFHRLLQHPSFNPKRPVWAWISCGARVLSHAVGAMSDPQVLRGGKGRSLVRGVMV